MVSFAAHCLKTVAIEVGFPTDLMAINAVDLLQSFARELSLIACVIAFAWHCAEGAGSKPGFPTDLIAMNARHFLQRFIRECNPIA